MEVAQADQRKMGAAHEKAEGKNNNNNKSPDKFDLLRVARDQLESIGKHNSAAMRTTKLGAAHAVATQLCHDNTAIDRVVVFVRVPVWCPTSDDMLTMASKCLGPDTVYGVEFLALRQDEPYIMPPCVSGSQCLPDGSGVMHFNVVPSYKAYIRCLIVCDADGDFPSAALCERLEVPGFASVLPKVMLEVDGSRKQLRVNKDGTSARLTMELKSTLASPAIQGKIAIATALLPRGFMDTLEGSAGYKHSHIVRMHVFVAKSVPVEQQHAALLSCHKDSQAPGTVARLA